VWREIEGGSEWIVDADLRDFFGSVITRSFSRWLAQRVADGRVLRLIKAMLKAGSYGKGISFPVSVALTRRCGVRSMLLSVGNHTSLWSATLTGKEMPFAVASRLEHRLDEAKHSTIRYPLGYQREKLLVIHDRKSLGGPRPRSTPTRLQSLATLCVSASFVDRPRRYPKLASSNSGSKIGSNRLSSAC